MTFAEMELSGKYASMRELANTAWAPVMHLVMHLEEKALHLVMQQQLGKSQQ